jgi:large subunit ribosomal protein L23
MKGISPLIQSVTTEKSSVAQSLKKYTFLVRPESTKVDIKKAIKELYGVDVKDVRIVIYPKKERLLGRGRVLIKRGNIKKAIVSLKGDKTIDVNKFKESKKK